MASCRELAADQRAGSVAHREILGERLTFLRRNAWRFAGGALFLAVSTIFVGCLLDSTFVWGAVAGAYIVGVPLLIGTLVVSATGTAFRSMGADAERWTASALRRARPRGWRLVNDVSLGHGNIDHVLVGPGGVIAVETKWTAASADTRYGRDFWDRAVAQIQSNARSLRLWANLRTIGAQVHAVLVVWGPGSRDLPNDEWFATDSGVVVVSGRALRTFVRQLPVDDLYGSQIERAWHVLDQQVAARDASDAQQRGSAGDVIERIFAFAVTASLAILSVAIVHRVTSSDWVTLAFVCVTSLAAVILVSCRLFMHAALAWIAGFALLIPLTLLYVLLG
jgi:hypothetical protein